MAPTPKSPKSSSKISEAIPEDPKLNDPSEYSMDFDVEESIEVKLKD